MAWIDDMIGYLKKFKWNEVDDLCEKMNVHTAAKSKNHILVNELMSSFEGNDLLKQNIKKYEINVKTIQLKESGHPKEAMSFAPINFTKIVNEIWEESDFRNYLLHDFLFFVFKKEGDKNYLVDVFKWNMPIEDLDGEVKDVWKDTQNRLLSGDLVEEPSLQKMKLKFKNEKNTKICHVRPHGSSGLDLQSVPVPDKETGIKAIPKQSFWFNHSYIIKILETSKKGE